MAIFRNDKMKYTCKTGLSFIHIITLNMLFGGRKSLKTPFLMLSYHNVTSSGILVPLTMTYIEYVMVAFLEKIFNGLDRITMNFYWTHSGAINYKNTFLCY